MYDPITGRWLSKDPIGISGGLNQYVAFANNPVMYVDPDGANPLAAYIGKLVAETAVSAGLGALFNGKNGAIAGAAGGFVGGLNPSLGGPIGAGFGAAGNATSYAVGTALQPGPFLDRTSNGYWQLGLGASAVIGGATGFFELDSVSSGFIAGLIDEWVGFFEDLEDAAWERVRESDERMERIRRFDPFDTDSDYCP